MSNIAAVALTTISYAWSTHVINANSTVTVRFMHPTIPCCAHVPNSTVQIINSIFYFDYQNQHEILLTIQSKRNLICGTNGVFYSNKCELDRDKCLEQVQIHERPLAECSKSPLSLSFFKHRLLNIVLPTKEKTRTIWIVWRTRIAATRTFFAFRTNVWRKEAVLLPHLAVAVMAWTSKQTKMALIAREIATAIQLVISLFNWFQNALIISKSLLKQVLTTTFVTKQLANVLVAREWLVNNVMRVLRAIGAWRK